MLRLSLVFTLLLLTPVTLLAQAKIEEKPKTEPKAPAKAPAKAATPATAPKK